MLPFLVVWLGQLREFQGFGWRQVLDGSRNDSEVTTLQDKMREFRSFFGGYFKNKTRFYSRADPDFGAPYVPGPIMVGMWIPWGGTIFLTIFANLSAYSITGRWQRGTEMGENKEKKPFVRVCAKTSLRNSVVEMHQFRQNVVAIFFSPFFDRCADPTIEGWMIGNLSYTCAHSRQFP